MFAFSFTALRPFGFIRATLAFCGCLWLGAAAWSDEKPGVDDLDALLRAHFGPLDWTEEHRFPTECDPLPDEETVLAADALNGVAAAPAGMVTVEGPVAGVFEARGRWYINFGADYRSDFTVSLQGKALSTVRRFWPDPENWAGSAVRVRGFADAWNGVFIEWEFPAQLCFLGQVPYQR
ncbi:MAG: hypothetical protein ACPG42_00650 [Alphaproteobacteria bacterium]